MLLSLPFSEVLEKRSPKSLFHCLAQRSLLCLLHGDFFYAPFVPTNMVYPAVEVGCMKCVFSGETANKRGWAGNSNWGG